MRSGGSKTHTRFPFSITTKTKWPTPESWSPLTCTEPGAGAGKTCCLWRKNSPRDLNGDGLTDVWGLAHDISHGWKSSGYYEIWGLQAGEYFVSPDGYYRGNQPAFVDMVQWWADLYNVHHVMQSPRPGVSTLPSGLSAMIMYGTHLHASADWRKFRTWDMAPLPNLPQNKAYNYMFEHGAWVVNKNCADIDATMKFVEFC